MNIVTIMNYKFDNSQINELKLCLLWINQAKLWLKPKDNIFIYTSKKLPKILTDQFLPNFHEGIYIGSPNLEPSAPKEYTEMIWYKLYTICHFPYKALFLDADAIIVNDLSVLEQITLNTEKPIFMIDHERDIHGHTLDLPPTINSGVMLFNNLQQTKFNWNALIAFAQTIGFAYKYKHSTQHIPGNDQSLLQCYCNYINYNYSHKIFDIKFNTCAIKTKYKYKDYLGRIAFRSIDNLKENIYINHYWGPFKPWKINCPLFTDIRPQYL